MKRAKVVAVVFCVLAAQAVKAELTPPQHVTIDVSALTSQEIELELALYDNSEVIGDSWVLIDNVVLGGVTQADFESGTLEGFDDSLNPGSVSAVPGSLDGTGSYVMRIDEDPVTFVTFTWQDYPGSDAQTLEFDLQMQASEVDGFFGLDEFVVNILDPDTLTPLLPQLGIGGILSLTAEELQTTAEVLVGPVDTIPPTVTCAATDTTVDADCAAEVPFSATITDDTCVEASSVTVQALATGVISDAINFTATQTSGTEVNVAGTVEVRDVLAPGATVEIWVNAIDCIGNTPPQPCTAVAAVSDSTPPMINCPGDITTEQGSRLCSEVETWLESTEATDNCDPDVDIVHDAPVCGFPYGETTTITWTATDDCGNQNQCSADITVEPMDRVDFTGKGSLVVFPNVEVRWALDGDEWQIAQETFLDLSNDYPASVAVQLYFFQGDPSLDATAQDRAHPGWNWVDNQIFLTANEPTYWAASSGLPKGVSPFTVLDPGDPPGRPVDPGDPQGERMLRGFVVAWAVNGGNEEIRWNHLKGDALLVRYEGFPAAWEYNAISAAVNACDVAQGEEPRDCVEFDENHVCCAAEVIPGRLDLDAFQYDIALDQLLLDFYSVGAPGLDETIVGVDLELTLLPGYLDMRQETEGPTISKAKFDIWNMNEVKFSNTERCVSCWDQELLSNYDPPNHFLWPNLQTDKGKARIDGMQSQLCPGSMDVPLFGVAAKMLTFDTGDFGMAGMTLPGLGTQKDGRILYDVQLVPPPELPAGGLAVPAGDTVGAAASLAPPADGLGTELP